MLDETTDVLLFCCYLECPDISMVPLSGMMCGASGKTEVVLYEPTTVMFNCLYDNPPSTTTYEWFVNDVSTGITTNPAAIPISERSSVVKCRAKISETAECVCDNSTTIDVTIVRT